MGLICIFFVHSILFIPLDFETCFKTQNATAQEFDGSMWIVDKQ